MQAGGLGEAGSFVTSLEHKITGIGFNLHVGTSRAAANEDVAVVAVRVDP